MGIGLPPAVLSLQNCSSMKANRTGTISRGIGTWNSLPEYLRDPELSIDSFRRQLKTFLFAQYWRPHSSALETFVPSRSVNLSFTFTLFTCKWCKSSQDTINCLCRFLCRPIETEPKILSLSKISNLCDTDPPTSQTVWDRQTDRQGPTTCNRNTALCTRLIV